MEKKARYFSWLYRRKVLTERGEEMNRGIINKLNRKIRNYEKENKE